MTIRALLVHKKTIFYSAVLWTIAIIFLSLVSLNQTPKIIKEFDSSDKLAHFIFYAVFVFLWGSYYSKIKNKIQHKTLIYIVIVALLLGGLLEICQELFTQRRTADWFDMLANGVGAFFGVIVLYLCNQNQPR